MIKKLLIVLCVFSLSVSSQTKKNTKVKTKPKTAEVDSFGNALEPEEPVDPYEALEMSLPLEVELDPMTGKKIYHPEVKKRNDSLRADLRARLKKEKMTFWARTKYPDPKAKVKQRTQLCMNIVAKDTNLVYCTNDSILMDPEVAKVLFQKSIGDSTYLLIFLDAFTKSSTNELCGAGHETKLYFVRWNTKTNKAKFKSKNIASCIKGITNMTKTPIANWDKSGPLDVRYNRSFNFYEIRFDPEKPQLGIQSLKDDAKDAKKED